MCINRRFGTAKHVVLVVESLYNFCVQIEGLNPAPVYMEIITPYVHCVNAK